KSGGGERIATLRVEMQKIMEESAGIYRTDTVLQPAAQNLRKLQDRLQDVSLDDRSYTFNTELTSALELSYMLDVAEAIVQSALQRRESRGSHQRTDYPQRDDHNYLAHSLAFRMEDGPPRIEYLPVTITRWPPGQRVYGK
ncbi:MAG TPA: succinate dehydrogenase/fumarate reductase flavoprotein subunit, partial [Candidatus Methylomirabilis sp.]|nr:succinate dehydrogenase/fumarate reductase flavoprotein subunit [Candidatus Methylomirabilis sp.]